MTRIVRQLSSNEDGVTEYEFVLEVDAVNSFAARQKARRKMRMEFPLHTGIFNVDVVGESRKSPQTTFDEIFPESFGWKTFRVRVYFTES